MSNPIYHSAYTAAQIEALIANGVPKIVSGTWWRWDISTGAYVDTHVSAEGAQAWHGLADDFSESETYVPGQYVMYGGYFWMFTAQHSPGAWNSAEAVVVTVGEELERLNQNVGFHLYGFHVDSSESDPSTAVTYLADAVGMTPAHMDYANSKFFWGSWKDAFFLPRPCMLKYDGTVDYYLSPDDYTKKMDSSSSDVADDTYAGNAMMEWGQNGKLIWYKIVPDTDPTSASVYIADYQADADFHAWSFVNNQGVLVPHFYTAIYNGSLDSNGKLRSISGKTYSAYCNGKSSSGEVTAAELNNPGTDKLWYTEVYSDITLINLLLILMAKSIDTQTAYGNGKQARSGGSSNMLTTGLLNAKGLFFGYNDNTHQVKILGMEGWWGNQLRRYAGHVLVNGTHKVKMTRGRQDGSSADDYVRSTTAANYNGYLSGAAASSGNGFISQMTFDANCMMPTSVGGSSASYWCDNFSQDTGVRYAIRGGNAISSEGSPGAFNSYFAYQADKSGLWTIGAALSCKPLA